MNSSSHHQQYVTVEPKTGERILYVCAVKESDVDIDSQSVASSILTNGTHEMDRSNEAKPQKKDTRPYDLYYVPHEACIYAYPASDIELEGNCESDGDDLQHSASLMPKKTCYKKHNRGHLSFDHTSYNEIPVTEIKNCQLSSDIYRHLESGDADISTENSLDAESETPVSIESYEANESTEDATTRPAGPYDSDDDIPERNPPIIFHSTKSAEISCTFLMEVSVSSSSSSSSHFTSDSEQSSEDSASPEQSGAENQQSELSYHKSSIVCNSFHSRITKIEAASDDSKVVVKIKNSKDSSVPEGRYLKRVPDKETLKETGVYKTKIQNDPDTSSARLPIYKRKVPTIKVSENNCTFEELTGLHHGPCRQYASSLDVLELIVGVKSQVTIKELSSYQSKTCFIDQNNSIEPPSVRRRPKAVKSTSTSEVVRGALQSGESEISHVPTSSERAAYKRTHPASDDDIVQKTTPLLHVPDYSQIEDLTDEIPVDLPDPNKVARHFVAGLARYKRGKYSEAKLRFTKCQSFCNSMSINGKADRGLCYVYLGDCDFTTQHYQEAAKNYSMATHLYSPFNISLLYHMVPPSISAIHAKAGSALRHARKMVDAVQEYKLAIEKALTDKDKLAANTSLGNLYQSLGENSSALDHYKQSIKLSEELLDYVALGWAHGNLGNAYLGLFQKDKALHHLQKALELTVDHELTPQAIGRTYNNLGTAYQSLGDLDKAQEHYDLALAQAVFGNDVAGQARVYGNIGNVFMLRKDYEKAIPHYAEVLKLSKDRSTLSTAHHNRGCAYYEWAETKMEALTEKKGQPLYFHGPGFEKDARPAVIPVIADYYRRGSNDLQEVVQYHEESLDNIKGSSKGLNLSISLFETNSRTFHRLQDCLVNLGEYTHALLVAEQSRARTLGELMLTRKGWSLPLPPSSPMQFDQVVATIANRTHPVLYLSYTGARLLGWVFVPQDGDVQMNMFEVPLSDDQFDGKSFDYHLRYSLTEALVERSFEMYRGIEYNDDSSNPVRNLYHLIAEPLIGILEKHTSYSDISKVAVISDSYTALLPYSSFLGPSNCFLGDTISFQLMPSLLSMSILDQLPSANVVHLPADAHSMCIAGNPSIPQFTYNSEVWNLGKLPHAKWEAEWVSHIIKTTPILEEQATKSAILMRIQSAKVIHLATHGSASAGFMAFGAMVSVGSENVVDASSVLLYPEDVERLNISPALVVLSSCDSGRGTVKADGIQGMARAFILAGAQAVLTTLWRVPDESAAFFMQFFYQYMMDGMESTLALRKAILSIRCFAKYSQYIHWSGYQLTGRDVYFESSTPSSTQILEERLGAATTFPRLNIMRDLESALVKDPCYPTDVQVSL